MHYLSLQSKIMLFICMGMTAIHILIVLFGRGVAFGAYSLQMVYLACMPVITITCAIIYYYWMKGTDAPEEDESK